MSPTVSAEDDIDVAFMPMALINAGYGSEYFYETKKWSLIKTGFTKMAVGDIAFAKITPCFQNRKSFILEDVPGKIAAATTELNVLRLYGQTLYAWYVLYFLKSDYFIKEAKYKGTAGQQRVLSSYIKNKLFPIPPYNEQYRIIEKIQEVLPVVDKYEKSQKGLDKLNALIFDQLRKSILQEAIQGKLVSQIAEEGTAQELLEQIKVEKQKLVKEGKLKKSALTDSIIYKGDDNKYYEQVSSDIIEITDNLPFEIPNSWEWCRLRDLCAIFTGATFKKEDANTGKSEIRILRGGNVLPYEIVKKADDIFLARENVKESILLKQNDIITPAVTSLENIGKMARIAQDMTDTTVGGFVFVLRPHYRNSQLSKYLLFLMSSPSIIEYIKSITNKSGQAFYNIGKERLAMTLLPIPPIAEQQRIVDIIENVFDKIKVC